MKNLFNDRADLVIRLTAIALLWSHICSWTQWTNPDFMVSVFNLSETAYLCFMIIFGFVAGVVILFPKLWTLLVISILVSIVLDLNSLTEYTYNYLLLLIFSGLDRSLKLSLWLIAIQEIWAGVNKFNTGYINVISFFSLPFENFLALQIIVIIGTLLTPFFEIIIGTGILLRWKATVYLTFIIHGFAIVLLCTILHYAEVVWSWNILILALIYLFYKWRITSFNNNSRAQLLVIIILMIIPFSQFFTTTTKPICYRMYTGNEIQISIDQKSYLDEYSQKVRTLPYSSIPSYEHTLANLCKTRKFNQARIDVPGNLFITKYKKEYHCKNSQLLEMR